MSAELRTLLGMAGAGHLHVVGGAVRDRLLGRPTPDIDLIMKEDPRALTAALAARLKARAFPLDVERGIHRVALGDGRYLDFARWQEPSFEADLDRRDFTINALAVPLEAWLKSGWRRAVIDRHDGRRDLSRRVVRSVGPGVFRDDPLRLLRSYRVATEIGFRVEPRTAALVRRDAGRLMKVAAERVREELMRLFSCEPSWPALFEMEKVGLLDRFLPEAKALRRTAVGHYGAGGVLKHTLESFRQLEAVFADLGGWFPGSAKALREHLDEPLGAHPRRAHLKWAVLLHDIGKPATAKMLDGRLRFFEHEHVGAEMVPAVAERLRFSADEAERAARLVRHHMRPGSLAMHPPVTDKAMHRFFRDLGGDALGMLLVSLGDHLSYLTPAQRKRRASPHEITTRRMVRLFHKRRSTVLPERLVTGHDVMKLLGIPPSPLVGELLKDLTEAQVEGRVKDKAGALAHLKEAYACHPSQTRKPA